MKKNKKVAIIVSIIWFLWVIYLYYIYDINYGYNSPFGRWWMSVPPSLQELMDKDQ